MRLHDINMSSTVTFLHDKIFTSFRIDAAEVFGSQHEGVATYSVCVCVSNTLSEVPVPPLCLDSTETPNWRPRASTGRKGGVALLTHASCPPSGLY